jgi:hypothetical protein
MFILRYNDGNRRYGVGHYEPSGEFRCWQDFDTPEEAVELCSHLNGGPSPLASKEAIELRVKARTIELEKECLALTLRRDEARAQLQRMANFAYLLAERYRPSEVCGPGGEWGLPPLMYQRIGEAAEKLAKRADDDEATKRDG